MGLFILVLKNYATGKYHLEKMSSYYVFMEVGHTSNYFQSCLKIKKQISQSKWEFLCKWKDKMRFTKNKLKILVESYVRVKINEYF